MVNTVDSVELFFVLGKAELLCNLFDYLGFKVIVKFFVAFNRLNKLFVSFFAHVEQVNLFERLVEALDLVDVDQLEQTLVFFEVLLILGDFVDAGQ